MRRELNTFAAGSLVTDAQIHAELSDWVEPGSSSAVFPNAGSADAESPGLLAGLLPT